MKLILASGSPRRFELLKQAGFDFKVITPGISEENFSSLPPRKLVARLSREKALAVSGRLKKGYVLAADTIVVCRGTVLGKPEDREDARRMLRLLSGRQHKVLTGITLINSFTGNSESGISITKVWLQCLDENEVDDYISTGETMGKAGAYAIQGRAALFVER